jgi:hypothetical protein
MNRRLSLHLVFAGAIAACLSPLSAADDAAPPTVDSGGLTFTATSPPWTAKEKPRQMSQGGFIFTSAEEGVAPLEADFYYFGEGAGGSAEANIARWKGQFKGTPEMKTEKVTYGDKEVTTVHITGTYMLGAMFGPKTATDGHALLGVIAPGEGGPVFIKMTGTQDSVAKAKAALEKVVASAYE